MKKLIVLIAAFVCNAASAAVAINSTTAPLISIDPSTLSTTIPLNFVGVSFEASSTVQTPSLNNNANLKAILSSLCTLQVSTPCSGHFRFGGGTSDTYNFNSNMARLTDMANFVASFGSGWPALFGLPCPQTNSPTTAAAMAANEATLISAVLGSAVTYQIGNEPNYYNSTITLIPSNTVVSNACQSFPSYQSNWQTIHDAVVAAVPGAKFAGPDSAFSTNSPTDNYTPLFAAALGSQVQYLSSHTYGFGSTGNLASDILSAWNQTVMTADVTTMPSNASVVASGLKLRLTESGGLTGTYTSEGQTIAASLYILWEMVVLAQNGWLGLDVHSGDATVANGSYWPFQRNVDGTYSPNPTLYAMVLFDALVGGQIEALTSSLPSNVIAFAVKGADGKSRVLVINKTLMAYTGVRLQSTSSFSNASVLQYAATGYGANPMQLGFATIASNGSFSPTPYTLQKNGGILYLNLPPSGAVLITLNP